MKAFYLFEDGSTLMHKLSVTFGCEKISDGCKLVLSCLVGS